MFASTGLKQTAFVWLMISLGIATCVVGQIATADDSARGSAEIIKALRRATQAAVGFRPKLDADGIEFLEALLDMRDQKQWSELFRFVDEKIDPVRNQLVSTDDGVWIPLGEYCRRLLRTMPEDGRATIQLHLDARAKSSLQTARTTTDIELLYRLYRQFDMSSHGAEFAAQLASALFQHGDFLEAASIWQSILEDYPATGVAEARILTMQATAYDRANDRAAVAAVAEQLRTRYPQSEVHLGGTAVHAAHLAAELLDRADTAQPEIGWDDIVALGDDARWQWSTFWPEIGDRRKPSSLLFGAHEAVCVVHLGHKAAGFNRRTGKLAWIVEAPRIPIGAEFESNPEFGARQLRLRDMVARDLVNNEDSPFPTPADPIADHGRFYLRMQHNNVNGLPESAAVVVAMDILSGRIEWSSEQTVPDMWIASDPQPGNNHVFVVARNNDTDQLSLLALRQSDGQPAWQIALGSMQSAFSPWTRSPLATLEIRGNRLLIVFRDAAVLSVNPVSRSVRWLHVAHAGPIHQLAASRRQLLARLAMQRRIQFAPDGMTWCGSLNVKVDGSTIVAHDGVRQLLLGFDDNRRRAVWNVPSPGGELLAVESNKVYAMNQSTLLVVSTRTGMVEWSTTIPDHFGNATRIGRYLLVPTRHGIYTIDRRTRQEQLIRTLPDIGVVQRVLHDRHSIITISNEMVTLFALAP